MSKKWLRKRAVRVRYGDCSDSWVERASKDGRLPPPKFPFGNNIPAWLESELDERDREIAQRPHTKQSN
jgi:predicted DNA-binding transcriptional regulator AlpA